MDPAEQQADAVPRGGRRGARMRRPVAQRQQQDQEDDEQIDEVRFELLPFFTFKGIVFSKKKRFVFENFSFH